MSEGRRRVLLGALNPQVALSELIHAGLAAGKVEATPQDRDALARDMAREAAGPHFRQRWRLPRAGRCACGCGEKIAANKQFKFGHEQGKPADPESEAQAFPIFREAITEEVGTHCDSCGEEFKAGDQIVEPESHKTVHDRCFGAEAPDAGA